MKWTTPVGHGGTLVESMPFDRRVMGSNPALGPWASPSLTVACGASACKLRHSFNCCGRERLRVVVELTPLLLSSLAPDHSNFIYEFMHVCMNVCIYLCICM